MVRRGECILQVTHMNFRGPEGTQQWLEWWSPKYTSTSKSLEPTNVILFGKRVFAVIIKSLQIRSSWITRGGPKSSDKDPYKRQEKTQGEGRVEDTQGRLTAPGSWDR